MAEFLPALEFMLPHEGGYVLDSRDPGGETKYGISKKQYPNLDIEGLTKEQAGEIYKKDYWYPSHAASIESQRVANKHFDQCVNLGLKQAIKLLQRSCNDCGKVVVVDGEIGPVTLNAVNSLDGDSLVEAMKGAAIQFYQDLVARKPSLGVFLKGWENRAREG